MKARTKEASLDFYWNFVPNTFKRHVTSARAWWWKISRNLRHVEHEQRRELMRRAFTALRFNGIQGHYAQFGCHDGISFGLGYRESRRIGYGCPMWAFGSFSNPPAGSGGALDRSLQRFHEMCGLAGMRREVYRVVPGLYQHTSNVGAFHEDMPETISFAYIACEDYSSAKIVMDFLASRIRHGSIVAFDHYFACAANALGGERLACAEFLKANGGLVLTPYYQFGWRGMSFMVEDKAHWKKIDRALPREVASW